MPLTPEIPQTLELRNYQKEAVNDWLRVDGHGVFAMATGTGKTLTALVAATQVALHCAERNRPLLVLVIVPLLDLVEQWRRDAEWFQFRPAICHGNMSSKNKQDLKSAFSAARST